MGRVGAGSKANAEFNRRGAENAEEIRRDLTTEAQRSQRPRQRDFYHKGTKNTEKKAERY